MAFSWKKVKKRAVKHMAIRRECMKKQGRLKEADKLFRAMELLKKDG